MERANSEHRTYKRNIKQIIINFFSYFFFFIVLLFGVLSMYIHCVLTAQSTDVKMKSILSLNLKNFSVERLHSDCVCVSCIGYCSCSLSWINSNYYYLCFNSSFELISTCVSKCFFNVVIDIHTRFGSSLRFESLTAVFNGFFFVVILKN